MRSCFKLLLGFLLIFSFYAEAQNFCDPNEWVKAGMAKPAVGGFKVLGPTAGCSPFAVSVQPTVGNNYSYIFTYKGGDPFKGYTLFDTPNTTYTTQGSYKILQLASNGTLSVFCEDIEVFVRPNLPTPKVCSNRRVVVNIPADTVNSRYDSFLINWGDGTKVESITKSATMTATHQYANTSPRTISLTGVYKGSPVTCELPATASIVPSAVDISAVAITRVTARNDGLVDVKIQGAQGVTSELQMANPNSTTFIGTGQSISKNDTTTFTVRNADLTKGSYCFRLSANDGCENVGSTSNTVCTVSLIAVAQNRQNALKWSEYPILDGFQNYKIQKNGTSISTITGRLISTYTDAAVTCGEQYCYQIVAKIDKAESISELKCVKAISDEVPAMVRSPFVSVLENQQIEVRAVAPLQGATTYRYKTVFLKATAGSNDFVEVAVKDNALNFIDADVKTSENTYCYKIQYENACGNRSEPTPPLCSILLESKTGTTINWSNEWPFSVPVNRYVLQKYDEKDNLIFENDLGGNTTFSPDLDDPNQQLFRYRVLAFAQGNAALSYSNFYVFRRNAQVFIPDAFSPNGDNINDVLLVKGVFIDKFQMIILNRWGSVLFSTDNQKTGWDGTYNNEQMPEGTYIYKIEVIDALGQPFVKTGTVLLLR